MTHAQCPHELVLQDLLDGRLTVADREALETHVAGCADCRARVDALGAARSALARLRDDDVPADVEAALLAALRAEPLPSAGPAPAVPSATNGPHTAPVASAARAPYLPAWAWGLAAAAVLALVAWLAWPRPDASLPTLVARDFRAYRDGDLALDVRSTDVADVDAYFRRSSLGFPARVFDLGMMQFTVQGGRTHRLDDRASALFVYRGPNGEPIVCQMYPGVPGELPAPLLRRSHDGIEFQVYDVEGVTVVFWQEGSVMCVLAGEGPAEAIIQLAFAKAMKV
jgi:anti-sigma factor RsiW